MVKAKTLVIISGYFNPLHVGHIELIQKSKALGDKLIVIVNNDHQVNLKGAHPFMLEEERLIIVKNLKPVDYAILSIDEDRSVRKTLRKLYDSNKDYNLIFAQGGDRHQGEVPETQLCMELGIKQVDGVGEKIQSSSWLIDKSKNERNKNIE